MTSTEITVQPDQLIEAFNQQSLSLDEMVAKAEQGYSDAKQIMIQLMDIPGQDINALDLAWKKVSRGRKTIALLNATLAGAKAVIETVTEQRDEAIEELDNITTAIDNYDYSHEKLESFAHTIQDDGYTEGYDEGHEKARQAYNEELLEATSEIEGEAEETIVGDIVNQWNLSWQDARDLLGGLRGDDSLTDEQSDAFIAFLKVFKGETDDGSN